MKNEKKRVLKLIFVCALTACMWLSVSQFAQAEEVNNIQELTKPRLGRKLNKIPIQPFYPGPEYRMQMSEVLIGKTSETDALWAYAQEQLAEAEPKAKP